MTASLVEIAFISNPTEEKLLNNPEFQDKSAFAIAQGICDYLGVKIEKEQNPKIKVNNITIEGIIYQGSTLAPVRAFANALKLPVVYDNKTKNVTVGGVKIDTMNFSGVSYTGVRYLAETLGYNVSFDNKTKITTVYK